MSRLSQVAGAWRGQLTSIEPNPLPARAVPASPPSFEARRELNPEQARSTPFILRPVDIQVGKASALIAVAGGDHRPGLGDALRDLGKEAYQPLRCTVGASAGQ